MAGVVEDADGFLVEPDAPSVFDLLDAYALAGEGIGIEQIENGWRVWFYKEPIGILDHTGQKLSPIYPG